MGVPTHFSGYGISNPNIELIVQKLSKRGALNLGEHADMSAEVIQKTLTLSI
jgi:alcohol dehydrogenase YqhD (iron-dependent ADH family)